MAQKKQAGGKGRRAQAGLAEEQASLQTASPSESAPPLRQLPAGADGADETAAPADGALPDAAPPDAAPPDAAPPDAARPDAAPSDASAGRASSEPTFPVVGIGASAGGLAAFEAFFSAMPPDEDTGMAFVLVQHLSPDHKSILVELVKRYTRMKVLEAENGMVVQPNCTYIIPPNRDLTLAEGALWLSSHAESRGPHLTIDHFFRSLAAA